MAPPPGTRIYARLKCVQGHRTQFTRECAAALAGSTHCTATGPIHQSQPHPLTWYCIPVFLQTFQQVECFLVTLLDVPTLPLRAACATTKTFVSCLISNASTVVLLVVLLYPTRQYCVVVLYAKCPYFKCLICDSRDTSILLAGV